MLLQKFSLTTAPNAKPPGSSFLLNNFTPANKFHYEKPRKKFVEESGTFAASFWNFGTLPRHLPPSSFGRHYILYVLWVIRLARNLIWNSLACSWKKFAASLPLKESNDGFSVGIKWRQCLLNTRVDPSVPLSTYFQQQYANILSFPTFSQVS